MKWIWLIIPFMVSCSTNFQQLSKDVFYKRDLPFIADNKQYSGTTVLPEQDKYSLVFQSYGDLTYLVIRTCHREDTFKPEAPSFLFIKLNDKKVQYDYLPTEIEKREACPLRVDSYDAKEKQHAWMFVDFRTRALQVNGSMTCNGQLEQWESVAVCQARKGLVQQFKFPYEVSFAPPKPSTCAWPVDMGDNTFEITASPEECLYAVRNRQGEMGRITVIGYSGLLVRGGI
jgi:hypothetical protein